MKKLLICLFLINLLFPQVSGAYTIFPAVEQETATYGGLPSPTGTQFTNNENVKTIKYGSGISLSSLTVNISGGTSGSVPAFLSNPSVDLRLYPFKHSLVSGGKTLVGFWGGNGTVETLDVETCTDPGYDNTALWTQAAGTAVTGGKGVFTAAAAGAGIYQTPAAEIGALYKQSQDLIVTIGSACVRYSSVDGPTRSTSGSYSSYITSTQANPAINTKAVTEFTGTVDNRSSKKVLTPSATGITIVDAQGSSNSTWASNDGINVNSFSFTDTITAQ